MSDRVRRDGLVRAIEIVRERHAGNPVLLQVFNEIAAQRGYGPEDFEQDNRKQRRTNKDEAYDKFSNRYIAEHPILPLDDFATVYRRTHPGVSDSAIVNRYIAALEARENAMFEAFRVSPEYIDASRAEAWAGRIGATAPIALPYVAPPPAAAPAAAARGPDPSMRLDDDGLDFGRPRKQPVRRKRRNSNNKRAKASFGRTRAQIGRRKRRSSKARR